MEAADQANAFVKLEIEQEEEKCCLIDRCLRRSLKCTNNQNYINTI